MLLRETAGGKSSSGRGYVIFSRTKFHRGYQSEVLGAGIEPARGCPRGILSPLRLPISPPEQSVNYSRSVCAPADAFTSLIGGVLP